MIDWQAQCSENTLPGPNRRPLSVIKLACCELRAIRQGLYLTNRRFESSGQSYLPTIPRVATFSFVDGIRTTW
jgi:hypothetical protein